MEYGITIAIVALFWIVYICTRPKLRDVFFKTYCDEEFNLEIENFVKTLSHPLKCGGVSLADKFKKQIKLIFIKLKLNRGGRIKKECEKMFKGAKCEIDKLLKTDFTELQALPSVGKESRTVILARFALAHSNYIFTSDRVTITLDAENKSKELTFFEISQLKLSFKYALCEKLALLSKNVQELLRMERLAKKYVDKSEKIYKLPTYSALKRNKLFIELCAENVDYVSATFVKNFNDAMDKLSDCFNNVIDSLKNIELYDFSVFYAPLEILREYKNFAYAKPNEKIKFLELLGELSDKENLDETQYSKRLKNLVDMGNISLPIPKQINVFWLNISMLSKHKNIMMLATALKFENIISFVFGVETKKKKKKYYNKRKNV